MRRALDTQIFAVTLTVMPPIWITVAGAIGTLLVLLIIELIRCLRHLHGEQVEIKTTIAKLETTLHNQGHL